jgi:hypothetical protein
MTDPASIFGRATSHKDGALKHPTARAFAAPDWADALAALAQPSERDASLALSAI